MKQSIPTLVVLFFFLFTSPAVSDDAAGQPMEQDRHAGAVFDKPQRLGELMGSDVVNEQGEKLGTVDDLVANDDGRIDYLILSKGGVLGIGGQRVAIPLDAVSPRMTDEGELRIAVDLETLDAAPTFSARNYPDFSDPQWQQEARGYFENGESPFREYSPGIRRDGATPGMRRQEGPPPGMRDEGAESPLPAPRQERSPARGEW